MRVRSIWKPYEFKAQFHRVSLVRHDAQQLVKWSIRVVKVSLYLRQSRKELLLTLTTYPFSERFLKRRFRGGVCCANITFFRTHFTQPACDEILFRRTTPMKKFLSLLLSLAMLLSVAALADETHGNYSDEMKIPYAVDLSPEDGADSVERAGDHVDSPYFSRLDFYNMTSTDTLTILPHFQTMQQTSEWSCGVVSALMVMNWYGKLGDYNEQTLAQLRGTIGDKPGATSMSQMVDIFNGVGGFNCYSAIDAGEEVADIFTFEYIQQQLAAGNPIMIGWNDWGGHWQVIIGYDTMGTETTQDDVIIVADPYDTTDHNQDGYGVYAAERFLYNFTFYNFFSEESGELNDYCFLVATPEA